jgi:hypothetical protein
MHADVLDSLHRPYLHRTVFGWLRSVWDALVIHQPNWISNVSNLTSITTLGALGALYKKFLCEQRRCWRIGSHRVDGTTYRTCGRHTTAIVHADLTSKHARRRPSQHAFLNDEAS